MRLRRLAGIGLAAALGLGASLASAAEVSVGAGSSFSLGSSLLDLGCADLVVVGGTLHGSTGTLDQARDVSILNGTLNGDSATLNVTGDWTNSGIFNAGTSAVNFVDGCGRSSATVSGNSSFFDLDVTTSSGKLVAFTAGSTTTVTDSLALGGASGQRLQIRSTLDGSEAYLDLQGSQSVAFVEVKDNHAVGNEIYYGSDSSSLGNTDGWVLLGIPVPALGASGLVLLAGLLMAASAVALQRRGAAGRAGDESG